MILTSAFEKIRNIDWWKVIFRVWALLAVAAIIAVVLIAAYAMSPESKTNEARIEYDRRDAIVQECLNSEQYTREECIILAG